MSYSISAGDLFLPKQLHVNLYETARVHLPSLGP